MKYNQFNDKQAKKFWEILDRMGRTTETRYDGKCEKEVFIRRTLSKWTKGKAFQIITEEETGFHKSGGGSNAWNPKPIMHMIKSYVYIMNVSYVLGHSEEVEFWVNQVAQNTSWNMRRFNQFDLNKIHFTEISEDKFNEYNRIFADDRDYKEFKLIAYPKKRLKKRVISVKARDRYEAITILEEEHPDYLTSGQLEGED